MKLRLPLLIALCLSVSGCNQHPDQSSGTLNKVTEFRSFFDDRSNAPYPLSLGKNVSGELVSPGIMEIDEVGIQIATNGGTAVGKLSLMICQSGLCSSGERDLTGAPDNNYMWIKLSPRLPITHSDGPLTYQITRSEGTNELYIWMYPSYGEKSFVNEEAGRLQKTANLVFRQH